MIFCAFACAQALAACSVIDVCTSEDRLHQCKDLLNKAGLAIRLEDYDVARSCLGRALELSSSLPEAPQLAAVIYENEARLEEQCHHLDAAVKCIQQSMLALSGMGNQSREFHSRSIALFLEMGRLYTEAGQLQLGQRAYQAALDSCDATSTHRFGQAIFAGLESTQADRSLAPSDEVVLANQLLQKRSRMVAQYLGLAAALESRQEPATAAMFWLQAEAVMPFGGCTRLRRDMRLQAALLQLKAGQPDLACAEVVLLHRANKSVPAGIEPELRAVEDLCQAYGLWDRGRAPAIHSAALRALTHGAKNVPVWLEQERQSAGRLLMLEPLPHPVADRQALLFAVNDWLAECPSAVPPAHVPALERLVTDLGTGDISPKAAAGLAQARRHLRLEHR